MTEEIKRFNIRLALFYSVAGMCGAWLTGSLVCMLLFLCGHRAIAGGFRMYPYHVIAFYCYIGVIAAVYGVFLFGWFYRHPKNRTIRYAVMPLAACAVITVSCIPCSVLYLIQDMLYGFFPDDPLGRIVNRVDINAFLAGWEIVWYSFPLNLLGLALFLIVTGRLTQLFESGREPLLYRKLTQWNQTHPNRLFLISGTLLFGLALCCHFLFIQYQEINGVAHYRFLPAGWLVFGLVTMTLEAAAFVMALLCWCIHFLNWKLAWGILLAGSLLLAGAGIWNSLPQNRFLATMAPIYSRSMRLVRLQVMDSFCDDVTISGTMRCPDKHIEMLKERGILDSGGNLHEYRRHLTVTRIAENLYSFRDYLTPLRGKSE